MYPRTRGACLAGLVLTALSFAGCGGGAAERPSASAPAPAKVRALQRVGAAGGWILTDTALDWTAGSPSTVNAITPPGETGSDLSAAFFLDPRHGWAATQAQQRSEEGSELTIFRTSDGGGTWSSASLTAQPDVAGVSSLDFVDPEHGFLLATVESSSNFNVGDLYRTEDSGETWKKLTAPSGGSVRFLTPLVGFIAGGPAGDELYATVDGGDSWQKESVVLPAEFGDAVPVYSVPTFSDHLNGVLPVTLVGSTPATVFYSTTDGGASWKLTATLNVPGELGQGVEVPTKILDTNSWVVAAPSGERVFSTDSAGRSWTTIAPNGLPPGVKAIDFATLSDGWGLVAYGTCKESKRDCTLAREGLWTTDGGQTWDVLKK